MRQKEGLRDSHTVVQRHYAPTHEFAADPRYSPIGVTDTEGSRADRRMNAVALRTPANQRNSDWWERTDCRYNDEGQLEFAGHVAAALAHRVPTPAYFYSAERITENVSRLRRHLGSIHAEVELLYAMKSNRFPPVLSHLRGLGLGLDVCSPGEVRHALAGGFTPDQLSFTAGSLSRADYTALAGWPEIWVNADSITALRRIAEVSPGRTIGLRINPACGVGYRTNPLLQYAGDKPTKFGIYLDRFREALHFAVSRGLNIRGLHCHAGCGFLTPQLPAVDRLFTAIGAFLDAAPQIGRLNLGGGLGIPLVEGDAPLDLRAWAALVDRHFGNRGLRLQFEPGDYLVKDAGILLAEVTQVEEKAGRLYVGLNAGFNVHIEPAFYQLPLAPIPAMRREGVRRTATVVGNINEALDVWAADVDLPPLQEGDTMCLLNAGGYGASMASAHCLRTEITEHLLTAHPGAPPTPVADADTLCAANRGAWDRLYASTPALVWGQTPMPFLPELIGGIRAGLPAGARALDAGTGEGRNLPVLLGHGFEVHAIDASASALAKISGELRARVDLRQGALHATGYADGFFDCIMAIDVFETLPDLSGALRELARILKPGGVLVCNMPGMDDGVVGIDMQTLGNNAFLYRDTYYYRFIEPREAESLLRGAGLAIERACRCEWTEEPHPGFRTDEHRHVSQVYITRRQPARA